MKYEFGKLVVSYWQWETEVLGEKKTVPVQLYPLGAEGDLW
jgi:hypothetical protein